MKVYRRHKCQWQHRDGLDFVLCAFPWFQDVSGHGTLAVISWCAPSARFFTDEEDAHELADEYAFDGCGAGCRGQHDVVRIDPGPEAVPTPPSNPYLEYAAEVAEWVSPSPKEAGL